MVFCLGDHGLKPLAAASSPPINSLLKKTVIGLFFVIVTMNVYMASHGFKNDIFASR